MWLKMWITCEWTRTYKIKDWGTTYDGMERDTTDIVSNMYHGTTLGNPKPRGLWSLHV